MASRTPISGHHITVVYKSTYNHTRRRQPLVITLTPVYYMLLAARANYSKQVLRACALSVLSRVRTLSSGGQDICPDLAFRIFMTTTRQSHVDVKWSEDGVWPSYLSRKVVG